jgi:hypothetical protein
LKTLEPTKDARRMKQIHVYVLDLTKIDGNGDFSCPGCGTAISPDDYTEEDYSILETKVNSNGLEEVVIRCNRCASQLYLTGFSLLQKLSEIGKEKRKENRKRLNLIHTVFVYSPELRFHWIMECSSCEKSSSTETSL